MSNTVLLPSLTPDEARQIDQACDRFESAWKSDRRPDVIDYVGDVNGYYRSALLRQLLMLDWDYRIQAGDQPEIEDYRKLFDRDLDIVEEVGLEMDVSPASTRHASRSNQRNTLRSRPGVATCAEDFRRLKKSIADRYELENEVGHGGIGVVYRGRDLMLGRDLAIKVLRDTYADRSEARNRFIAEARVGSQLQHPAIVPVYELGWCDVNRPFITMKLVEGQTLAELLKNQVHTHSEWTPADLPQLLHVFEQVCQAMAYAHSRGIVHRDLKPSNIMVGAFGEVQVMDWGFAKQLQTADEASPDGKNESPAGHLRSQPEAATQSGAMMGTPSYMPPEQARGEVSAIDARTDVFALGAILCEILTGAPPYSGSSAENICKRAAAGDLTEIYERLATSAADPELCDLARRCLKKEQIDRPTNAGELAGNLTSYLNSAQEKLQKAQMQQVAAQACAKSERRVRRLALAFAAALLIGAGIATWQAFVATHAKNDALNAAAAEKEAKVQADGKETEASAILEFLVSKVVACARPKTEHGGMGPDVTIRAALHAAVPFVAQSFSKQPLIEARLHFTLAQSFYSLGDYAMAAEQSQFARTIYALQGQQQRLFDCMVILANSWEGLGYHQKALDLRKELLEIHKVGRGPNDLETLHCMTDVANSLHNNGQFAQAIELHEKALAAKKESLGEKNFATLMSMHNLANSYYSIGRRADALAMREVVLKRQREIYREDDAQVLISANALANSYNAAGRYADAVNLLEPTIERQKISMGPDHPDTLSSMNNLGNSYAGLQRFEDALKLRIETLKLLKSARGRTHAQTLAAMSNLANAYSDLRRFDEGMKLSLETIELQKEHLGPNDQETLRTMSNLAVMYNISGNCSESLAVHMDVLAKRRATLNADHPDVFRSLRAVSSCLIKLNRGLEAVPYIDECIRLAVGQVGDPNLLTTLADQRIRVFESGQDAEGCRATAELWETLNQTDVRSCYFAARFRAITARILRTSNPIAVQQANDQADRAMAWLNKVFEIGHANSAKLEENKDFEALRDRDDFRRLVETVRSRR